MNFEELPEFVKEKLKEMSQKTRLSLEDIVDEYAAIFNDDFIQNDPQFQNDEERHKYVLRALKIRLMTMPPVKKYTLIPVGYSDVRLTKKGQRMSTIFAVVVEQGKRPKLRRIVAMDKYAEIFQEIELFAKYDVKLGENRYGDLIVDSRTRFNNPEFLDIEPLQLLQSLGIPVIRIADAAKHKSLRGSDGYLIETDWRGVKGIIARKVVGKRKDGTLFGLYVVGDDSIDISQESVRESVVTQGFPVFAPPHQMKYSELSECYFFGTVDIDNRTNEPFMNCYLILPVHAWEDEEEGELPL